MALSKGYGPTGISYYNSAEHFVMLARNTPCELITKGGNTLRIDLSGSTDSELTELYRNAMGCCYPDVIQLTSV